MAHWRARAADERRDGLPFGVWWAIGEALTVPALMLSLKLMGML